MELILASSSPRRQQMLKDLNLNFRVFNPKINETKLRGEPALNYAQRLSIQKAECASIGLGFLNKKTTGELVSIQLEKDWAILSADTLVVLGVSTLGKPKNQDEALQFLLKLSGKNHEVLTAFCWLGIVKGKLSIYQSHVRTRVSFAKMSTSFWKWYASTKEPLDKAGAYAAQGAGMSFIEKVTGSYSNIVGLPLTHVLQSFLKTFGVDIRESCSKLN